MCEAVAALVQAAAGKVEGEGEAAFAQVGVDADVGVFRVHVRAAVQGVAQLVGDGIFDFERAELGVADALADTVEVDGEGAVGVDVFVPRYRTGKGVDVVGVCDFAFGDDPEDAARHARPQAEAVGDLKIARAGDDGDAEARVLQAEGFRFGEEDLFAAFGAGEDEGVLHGVPWDVWVGWVLTHRFGFLVGQAPPYASITVPKILSPASPRPGMM